MIKFLGTTVLLLTSFSSAAAEIKCTGEDDSLSNVIITSAVNTLTDEEIVRNGNSISSTACAGLFDGNDHPLPTYNTGISGDGLLNGETHKKGSPWFASTGAFITEDDLQDLDGKGGVNDPGWIYLGKDDGNGNGFGVTDLTNWYLNGETFELDKYLGVEFSCAKGCVNGEWSINFFKPEEMLRELSSTIFGNSFFDHLAFSFKVGNETIIYDFNFNLINDEINGVFDLSAPHNFSGKYDLSGLSKKDISHISLWARDPVNAVSVDEPSNLALFFTGFLLLGSLRRKLK
ncbi:MAG: hypothetical protein CL600_01850 [Alteromonas sp.]|nr:hypothetical protein [Alteromonas sp.]